MGLAAGKLPLRVPLETERRNEKGGGNGRRDERNGEGVRRGQVQWVRSTRPNGALSVACHSVFIYFYVFRNDLAPDRVGDERAELILAAESFVPRWNIA
ncbi:hypothetical protein Trydic_g9286 [Trypoxylus dichotomus]